MNFQYSKKSQRGCWNCWSFSCEPNYSSRLSSTVFFSPQDISLSKSMKNNCSVTSCKTNNQNVSHLLDDKRRRQTFQTQDSQKTSAQQIITIFLLDFPILFCDNKGETLNIFMTEQYYIRRYNFPMLKMAYFNLNYCYRLL